MKNLLRVLTYGILAIPIAFLGLPLYIYLPNFYVNEVGMNVAVVGAVLFIARLLDMLADPFIGRLSDTRIKRKNMILIGSVLILIGFYFLTHPTSSSSILYLLVFSVLTYIGFSLVNIPYLALNAQLGKDYYDNTRLSFSREICSILGILTALLLPYLFNVSENSKESLDLIYTSLLVVLPVVLVFFLLNIKSIKQVEVKYSFLETLKKFYKDFSKSKNIFIAFILNNLANAIPATLFLFYVELVLKREDLTGILLIVYFLSGVLSLPIWIYLSKKISKQKVWIISMTMASVVFCFVPFLNEDDYIAFSIISILTGMSLGADMAIPTSIQSDIAKRSEVLGNQVSGLLFGFWAMITKFSLAFAVVITFGILELVGFDSKNPDDLSLVTISLLYSILPVICKIIAIIFVINYKELH
ncbi:MFS transporter [Poseidonibacter lekithochrous]|uniref:MFS transporter n=1 Tax=Poseidonibacter lekithochrous TaxID=1904463 RepID=UPI0008FC43CB|nr:MFS transporter [Poseidonibacter lekithochrous]QKJ23033.1 major facilitator superfamily transporter [Poseidonibacter lekithochrous]